MGSYLGLKAKARATAEVAVPVRVVVFQQLSSGQLHPELLLLWCLAEYGDFLMASREKNDKRMSLV